MEDNLKMKRKQQNRVIAGLVLVIAGAALLLQNAGVIMAGWLFSWPVILIALGFFSGIKHNFRNRGGIFLMGVGGFFLLAKLLSGLQSCLVYLAGGNYRSRRLLYFKAGEN